MIAIRGDDKFLDTVERIWTGDQLARRIVEWAGIEYEEKSVRDLYATP